MTSFTVEPDGLRASSVHVGDVAGKVRAVEPVVTEALSDGDLYASAVLSPETAAAAARALLHAATNPDGLGAALSGNAVGNLVDGVLTATGSEGLAERIATDAIQLRIAAVTYEHPDLAANENLQRLTELLANDDHAAAAWLAKDMTGQLGDVAPVLPELLALSALLDENPLNDPVGWDVLDGRMPTVDPVLGIALDSLSERLDTGPGHAERIPTPAAIQQSGNPSLQQLMIDIGDLETDGRITVQTVTGADGVQRYVVALPGMNGDQPWPHDHPQDTAAAVHNALAPESPYTRAVRLAMADAGVPRGAEVLLVGHSLGGITAANLAQDPSFNGGTYRVTDVVSFGSPVDHKTLPPGSGTSAYTITNDRDIVPALDGQGAGSPFPQLAGRREYEFSSPGVQFPASHNPQVYADAVDGRYGQSWSSELNGALGRYTTGEITGTITYQLRDRPPGR